MEYHGVNGRILKVKEDSALAKSTVQLYMLCVLQRSLCIASAVAFYNYMAGSLNNLSHMHPQFFPSRHFPVLWINEIIYSYILHM